MKLFAHVLELYEFDTRSQKKLKKKKTRKKTKKRVICDGHINENE